MPVIWALFQITPDRYRWLLLLLASLVFYTALEVPYLLVALSFVITLTYLIGLWIHRCSIPTRKRKLLWSGIVANLAILAGLKYSATLAALLHEFRVIESELVAPLATIGVSFFTFQAISYLADIYLEIGLPERHFGRFALYISFFPKLLMGPIERGSDLLPQLQKAYAFDYHRTRSGLVLFLWGLFKKVVVANRLAIVVNTVYGNVHAYSGVSLLFATILYSFQIYADFSGYTDMAIGTARLFNIDLTRNFNSPYLAQSVADFWRRWHISFSRWILDYIFKPLQFSWRNWRTSGTAAALLITFLVSGIWHGASWGFVVWGILHGLYLAASVFYKPYQKRLHRALGVEKSLLLAVGQTVVTFCLVSFAWIFFRAASLADAAYVAAHLFSGIGDYLRVLASILFSRDALSQAWEPLLLGQGKGGLILSLLLLLLMAAGHCLSKRIALTRLPVGIRWGFYYFLVMAIYLLAGNPEHFIYFQF